MRCSSPRCSRRIVHRRPRQSNKGKRRASRPRLTTNRATQQARRESQAEHGRRRRPLPAHSAQRLGRFSFWGAASAPAPAAAAAAATVAPPLLRPWVAGEVFLVAVDTTAGLSAFIAGGPSRTNWPSVADFAIWFWTRGCLYSYD